LVEKEKDAMLVSLAEMCELTVLDFHTRKIALVFSKIKELNNEEVVELTSKQKVITHKKTVFDMLYHPAKKREDMDTDREWTLEQQRHKRDGPMHRGGTVICSESKVLYSIVLGKVTLNKYKEDLAALWAFAYPPYDIIKCKLLSYYYFCYLLFYSNLFFIRFYVPSFFQYTFDT
jgi:hypothetical protein